jgi:hypothetical protein
LYIISNSAIQVENSIIRKQALYFSRGMNGSAGLRARLMKLSDGEEKFRVMTG